MNSTLEDLRLLTRATKPFLDLSLFFFDSNDAKAVEARRKWSSRKPFYAYLYHELKELKDVLEALNETSRVTPGGRKAIETLLEHFERNSSRSLLQNQSVPARNRTYPRLHALLQIDDLNLGSLQHRIHLRHNSEEEFRRMITSIKECRKRLGNDGTQKRKYGHGINQEPILNKPSDKKQKIFSAHGIRIYANAIHKLLLQSWRCSCDTRPCPYTSIRLRLAAQTDVCTHNDANCGCKQAQFDLLFRSGVGNIKVASNMTLTDESWQHGEIHVLERRPVVVFSDSGDKQASKGHEQQEVWAPVEGVCDLIRTAAINNRRLTLCFRDRKLWHTQSIRTSTPEPLLDYSPQLSRSLADFIAGSQTPFTFREVKRRERFALAVTLANALLHFYQGPWCLQSWESTQIYFYQDSERRNVPDFRRPYLSTTCADCEPMANPLKVNIWEHPYPALQSFGCLLLGMELGRPIDMSNLENAFAEVKEVKDGELGRSFEDYFKAIEACLGICTFKPGGSFSNEEFIEQVWHNIVYPLETALYSSFPDMVGKLSSPSQLTDILSQRTLSSLNNKSQDHAKETGLNDVHIPLPVSSPTVSLTNSTSEQLTSSIEPLLLQNRNGYKNGTVDVCLHDDASDIAPVDPQEAKYADSWIQQMQEKVHPLLLPAPPEKIKIAILDTGVHLPEGCDLVYQDQIIECRSWLSTTEREGVPFDSNADTDGHGTHATGLLLDLAPHAAIYVARVFEGRNEKQGKEMAAATQKRVAQAIYYAVDVWKVHIISMSFGFLSPVREIDKAIVHARANQVLMLAAAANCGGNASPTWPAKSSLVICVHAATGVGNRYRTTPTRRGHASNFATLGSAVLSWWPEGLGLGVKVRKSGTSTATPVLAAIAATIMAVVRQPGRVKLEGDLEKLKSLGTADGMRAVLRRMVGENGKRDGYDYIAPWELLDASPGRYLSPTTIVDNILNDVTRL